MPRYKLTVEYDGSKYCGLQKQKNLTKSSPHNKKSIAEMVELAIFSFTAENIKIHYAGRTDAGVHAYAQILHFDLKKTLTPQKIKIAINHYLAGEDIVIIDTAIVDESFHSRFSAKQRSYQYRIINRQAPLILEKNRAWHISIELDLKKMIEASQLLIGIVDLSCFYPAKEIKSDKNNAKIVNLIRRINEIKIEETKIKGGRLIIIKIKAPSFFRPLVRNIVGTIILVGLKKISIADFQAIIANKKRDLAGPTAPPHGLYFDEVEY